MEATEQNAAVNGVALDHIGRANLREEPAPAADLVLANLMRPLLLRVAELMAEPPAVLIASGLLDHEADEVAAAFAPLREVQRYSDKGWTALRLAGGPQRETVWLTTPVTSCHQAASSAEWAAQDAVAAVARELARAAHGHHAAAGHGQAAVVEHHQRTGLVAARSQHADHRGALDSSGPPGSPMAPVHGFTVKMGERPERALGTASGSPIGPERQRSNSSSTPAADRAADQDVQPVARGHLGRAARQQRLVVAHDHADQRLARQLELVHAQPGDGVGVLYRVLQHLGAKAPDRAHLVQGTGNGGLVADHAQSLGQGIERRPLHQGGGQHHEEDDVEE